MPDVDNHGNVTNGLTVHDVLRWLVRGGHPNTEYNQQEALHAIDAHEQGFSDSAAWKEELKHRAEVAAEAGQAAGQADPDQDLRDRNAALEARVAQLEALARSASAPSVTRPAPPEPTA